MVCCLNARCCCRFHAATRFVPDAAARHRLTPPHSSPPTPTFEPPLAIRCQLASLRLCHTFIKAPRPDITRHAAFDVMLILMLDTYAMLRLLPDAWWGVLLDAMPFSFHGDSHMPLPALPHIVFTLLLYMKVRYWFLIRLMISAACAFFPALHALLMPSPSRARYSRSLA